MTDTETQSASHAQPVPLQSAMAVIGASAADALSSAVVVWLLGGVAVSVAGAFAGQMVPSPPPGFGGLEHGEHSHAWWHAVRGNALVLFFAIFFAHSLWLGFHGGAVGVGRRLQRILSELREHWFGLIVGNAIAAWVTTLVLGMVQNFSITQMLWHWLCGLLLAPFQDLGGSSAHGWRDWFAWYGANQAKLTFWFLYLAGAFDDLGVPNLKTLARWAWRRFQRRNSGRSAVPAEQRP
jgi:hypothetical protein